MAYAGVNQANTDGCVNTIAHSLLMVRITFGETARRNHLSQVRILSFPQTFFFHKLTMFNIKNFLKKIIPAQIIVRSLYWVEYEKNMENDLVSIFHEIDEGNLQKAQELINNFDTKYYGEILPEWVALKRCEIVRAQSMVNFLNANGEDVDPVKKELTECYRKG